MADGAARLLFVLYGASERVANRILVLRRLPANRRRRRSELHGLWLGVGPPFSSPEIMVRHSLVWARGNDVDFAGACTARKMAGHTGGSRPAARADGGRDAGISLFPGEGRRCRDTCVDGSHQRGSAILRNQY